MKKSLKISIIVISVILVLGLATGAFFYFGKSEGENPFSKLISKKGESALKYFDETGKDKDKIHIGDYVAYNEGKVSYKNDKGKEIYSSDGTLKWRVLGVEDGKIKLICDDSVFFSGPVNIDKVSEICGMFGKGEGAEKSRSITDKDLEKVVNLSNIENDSTSSYNALWRVADTYKTEYEILFKNEDGIYKEYAINTDIDTINHASIIDTVYKYAINFKSYKTSENFMPIVILKEDVKFDGKDETGAWKIKNSDKKYNDEVKYTEISSVEDLVKLTKEGADLNANYKLVNDIDLSEIENFGMIKGRFRGIFDGNNHTISGLKIDSSESKVGFFAETSDATIKNLTIKDAKITSKTAKNGSDVGILAGHSTSSAIINCNISGTITGTTEEGASGTSMCGLMVGSTYSTGIFNSKVSGNITSDYEYAVGGLVGSLSTASYVEKCIADVKIDVKQSTSIGGFVGLMNQATIVKCGVNGSIESTNPKGSTVYIAGFAHENGSSSVGSNISQCYSKSNINYNGKSAYISGFVTSTDKTIDIQDSYCTGKIKETLPEDAGAAYKNRVYSFAREGTIMNCYSNITDVGSYSDENKLGFYLGTLYFNKDTFNEVMDAPSSKILKQGTVVGLTTEELKNKDSFKDFDFAKKWKWNDEKSCLELMFE